MRAVENLADAEVPVNAMWLRGHSVEDAAARFRQITGIRHASLFVQPA